MYSLVCLSSTQEIKNRSLGDFYVGGACPKEEMIKFWERSEMYSGYKKNPKCFQRSHFQCIFISWDFLVHTAAMGGSS